MPEPSERVSVVVSCYNYGAFLTGAVESALAQTHSDLDVLIIDDGSTDDTPRVAYALVDKDRRVRYVRQENRGQAAAKNLGITGSDGAFVAFLDADDRWHPDKLEKQLALFRNPAVGVVYSRMRPVDENGRPLSSGSLPKTRAPKRGRVSEALFLDNFVPFSSTVVRRAVFDKVGVMDTSLAMGIDWDLWLRASVDFEFDFIDEELLDYRVGHAGQMSRRQEERHGWAEQIMRRFLERYPNAVRPAVVNKAWAYTLNNRGHFHRHRDLARSTGYYLRSIGRRPVQFYAYRGLLGNAWAAVRSALGRRGDLPEKQVP